MNNYDLSLSLEALGFESGRCVVFCDDLDLVKFYYSLPAAISFGHQMADVYKRDFHVFFIKTNKTYDCRYNSKQSRR